MTEIVISLDQLRGMIGLSVRHQGGLYRVIEVLEDGPSLVLQSGGRDITLQSNQYGDPQRWVPTTETVPVLTPERNALHPSFLALDLVE